MFIPKAGVGVEIWLLMHINADTNDSVPIQKVKKILFFNFNDITAKGVKCGSAASEQFMASTQQRHPRQRDICIQSEVSVKKYFSFFEKRTLCSQASHYMPVVYSYVVLFTSCSTGSHNFVWMKMAVLLWCGAKYSTVSCFFQVWESRRAGFSLKRVYGRIKVQK